MLLDAIKRWSILCSWLWLTIATPGYAVHPISSDVDIIGRYPVYPAIDYASQPDPQAVRRGEYMAKVGDCIACHTDTTNTVEQVFAGGLPIATPFGTFYTPNITPDKATGIGDWSEADFIRAMRQGIRADGSNAFPAFPYVYFNRMRESDLKDIWAYLRALPPIQKKNLDNTLPFPLDVRFFQYGWKWLFFYPDEGVYEDDPNQSAQWNRGAYLVKGAGHCSMCHTEMNLLGAAKKEYFLTGAFIEGYWAPDITSLGLAGSSRFEVADVFIDDELIHKAGKVQGPMAEANHDSLRYLTRDDQLAIAEYLKSVVSKQPRSVPERQAEQAPLKRGEQVYANVCVICHLDGKVGAPRIGDQADWANRLQQSSLSTLYEHAIDGYNKMPAKGACVTCSDSDISDAVDYILYHSFDHSYWQRLKNPPQAQRKQATSLELGESIYQAHCASCHDSGQSGAPIIGDFATWQPLLHKNIDTLITNTVNGIGAMPTKGGCEQCSGAEIIAAVKYLAQESQQEGKDYSLW